MRMTFLFQLFKKMNESNMPVEIADKYSDGNSYIYSHNGDCLLQDDKRRTGFIGKISDTLSFVLLCLLYLFQGIPLGLAFGSIPFLLKEAANGLGRSYEDIGIFYFASYPYSLKLIWSPIVDIFHFECIGRRKTWIIPLQLTIAIVFLWMGFNVERMMNDPGLNILSMTCLFTFLIVLCATQDIAVDGWALTMLSHKNIKYGPFAQTVGLNTGYFLSFTMLLALSSPVVCNKYFRTEPCDTGIFTLSSFLLFWGVFCLFVVVLVILKKEPTSNNLKREQKNIKSAYKTIYRIFKIENMAVFVTILLIHKFGYLASEIVSPLKLIEKGFKKEDLAIATLIDFPFQILFGFLTVKWSSKNRPLKPWLYALYARYLLGFAAMFLIYNFPVGGPTPIYTIGVLITTIVISFTSTIMFVSQGAFFTIIGDPNVGGMYMTFLHTFSNFAGTWPRYFILKGIDTLSETECVPRIKNDPMWKNVTTYMSCTTESEKRLCRKLDGICVTHNDGYYPVCSICIILGLSLLVFFIHKKIRKLERLDPTSWKLKEKTNLIP